MSDLAAVKAACDAGELDAAAKLLWDACPSRASNPEWEQLSLVTRDVWIERVVELVYGIEGDDR